jgi:hypothetical protein
MVHLAECRVLGEKLVAIAFLGLDAGNFH